VINQESTITDRDKYALKGGSRLLLNKAKREAERLGFDGNIQQHTNYLI